MSDQFVVLCKIDGSHVGQGELLSSQRRQVSRVTSDLRDQQYGFFFFLHDFTED